MPCLLLSLSTDRPSVRACECACSTHRRKRRRGQTRAPCPPAGRSHCSQARALVLAVRERERDLCAPSAGVRERYLCALVVKNNGAPHPRKTTMQLCLSNHCSFFQRPQPNVFGSSIARGLRCLTKQFEKLLSRCAFFTCLFSRLLFPSSDIGPPVAADAANANAASLPVVVFTEAASGHGTTVDPRGLPHGFRHARV